MEKKAIIFFGRSGSGKGTQADLLIKKIEEIDPDNSVIYIETGKLLRSFVKNNRDNNSDYTQKKVADILNVGGLLEEFMPINLWSNKMIAESDGNNHYIFDGVARRPAEAPILNSALDFYGIKRKHIIFIDVSSEWAMSRLLERGRSDDKEEEIKKRLSWFDEFVVPSLGYYRDNNEYEFHTIMGEQTIENVHKDIIKFFKFF